MNQLWDQIKHLPQDQQLAKVYGWAESRGFSPAISQLLDKILGTSVEAEVDHEAEERAFAAMTQMKEE